MATIRIEKTRDYTVMANHHLRNKELSLKAKGLLSYMLSLPEDWNYTLSGLATSCKDGLDSVRQAVSELESLFDKIGAPKSMAELGLEEKDLQMTFLAAKDIRDKYVLPRLAWDLGIAEELI